MEFTETQAAAFEDITEADRDDAVFTAETIEDFKTARASYNEIGVMSEGVHDGIAWLEIEGVQVRKGDRRTTLHVVDFGDFRACYS